jgi:hypothetical protein
MSLLFVWKLLPAKRFSYMDQNYQLDNFLLGKVMQILTLNLSELYNYDFLEEISLVEQKQRQTFRLLSPYTGRQNVFTCIFTEELTLEG